MKLIKKGWVFKPSGEFEWSKTHAQVPFALVLKDKIRVFYSTRDNLSRSGVTFLDISLDDPEKILYKHDALVLKYGDIGFFDDSGTMPSWFVRDRKRLLLYYTAWNRSASVSYRLSIGIAESFDDGLTFVKLFKGPIMDRSKFDPIWVGQPCVLKMDEGDWRMWYLSCQKIETIDNHPEPFYNIKYATSTNGIDWNRENITCIDFDKNTDAIGRPAVWFEDDKFKMLHSNRKADGYRSKKESGYRIEYSESIDGINWKSNSEKMKLLKSEHGWDSIMNEYCTTYRVHNKRVVLYNGNGFGETGFGFAIFED